MCVYGCMHVYTCVYVFMYVCVCTGGIYFRVQKVEQTKSIYLSQLIIFG